MNFLEDLFSEEELNRYRLIMYPFSLGMLRSAVDARLSMEPDFEVFIPLVYYKQENKLLEDGATTIIAPFNWFISNKGRVLSKRFGKPGMILKHEADDNGILQVVSDNKKLNETIVLSRAIGCAFVPLVGDMQLIHPKDLEVNHIDGDKTNLELTNLEWVIPFEAVTPPPGTVITDLGEF
jgi:hypothetical protein